MVLLNLIFNNTKDGIIKFTYKNKNKIIYNPDYYMVNTTIENLNNRNWSSFDLSPSHTTDDSNRNKYWDKYQ